MMRRVIGVTSALVVLALITVAVAQSRRPRPPALARIDRALLEGHYDEVSGLAQTLDPQDPAVAALVARAAIARGRYQEAEAGLRPIAQRAPTSDAALELGLLLQLLGRQDAPAILARVASLVEFAAEPQDLARGARALRALGRFQEANAAYRDATAAAPRDSAINTAWGDLFLETYNRAEALKSYQAVLRDDPGYGPALAGAARALAEDNPPEAQEMAKRALEINRSDVGVHVFLAREAADAGRRDDARTSLQDALAVNPSSLDAHALLAAMAYVEDETAEFDREVARVLAIAPRYGEVFRVAAEMASHNFRYDDAVVLARRALALDAGNPRILADIGVHLLRTGDESGGRAMLEDSFKRDPFNVVTYNLLQMMDTLDKFGTIRDGDIILRTHPDEEPVIGEFALGLARQALADFSRRYEFTPKGPILVEIFPKHDDFAVRTLGLPGMIGALGVCFGRVVAMDSPRARPGEFQWEATLWHELAHVVTMQMSNYRIPRWLTEGISVYEEKRHRPEWGRGMDMEFATLLNRGETLKLNDLNAAFTDPRKISLAYFQASLVVEHIVRTYGEGGLRKLLRAYGQGLDTPAALRASLGTDFERMQGDFDRTLVDMFGKLRAALAPPEKGVDLPKMSVEELKAYAARNPGQYVAHLALGHALRRNGALEESLAAFDRAAALAPMATGEDSPQVQIADIAMERQDRARAIKALQAAVNADFDNVELARRLAGLMKDASLTEPGTLRPVYERIVAIDPFDAEARTALGRIAMREGQPEAAVAQFKAVVALKPVDQAAAYTDLAESYFRSGKRPEARRQTLAALEIAPGYERAQDLLLELAAGRP